MALRSVVENPAFDVRVRQMDSGSARTLTKRGPSVPVPLAQRAHHTDPGTDAQLGEYPGQMGLHGAVADEQPLGDLVVGAALGHQLGHLELPSGQAMWPGAPAG